MMTVIIVCNKFAYAVKMCAVIPDEFGWKCQAPCKASVCLEASASIITATSKAALIYRTLIYFLMFSIHLNSTLQKEIFIAIILIATVVDVFKLSFAMCCAHCCMCFAFLEKRSEWLKLKLIHLRAEKRTTALFFLIVQSDEFRMFYVCNDGDKVNLPGNNIYERETCAACFWIPRTFMTLQP